jgi:CHAT domain-containing protein
LNTPNLHICLPASNGNKYLLDEGIHLAVAFQLAGFPYVIGTLWGINDQRSAQLAADVYGAMQKDDGLKIQRSAEALHHALRQLKDNTRSSGGFPGERDDDPLVWAPYIHVGA